jgi:NAD(P)-dependent dehydrogenase (short-subunit alcohol dehydrogenase family)
MKITKDLVVFITGGASGLGEATVRLLHSLGCKIAIGDIDEERMKSIKSELKERILTIKCDITIEEQVKNAVEETVKHYGTIHAVLASSGIVQYQYTID